MNEAHPPNGELSASLDLTKSYIGLIQNHPEHLVKCLNSLTARSVTLIKTTKATHALEVKRQEHQPQGLLEPMNMLLTHDLYENHPYDLPSHFQPPRAAALAELSQAVLKVAVPLAT